MRTVIAWIVGLVITVAVGIGISALGKLLGIPSDTYLGGPTTITVGSGAGSYDEEVESSQTAFGTFAMGLGILLGIRTGRTIYSLRWDGGLDEKAKISFRAWGIGLSILLVLAALISLAFERFHGSWAEYIRYLLEVGATVGVAWALRDWYLRRTSSS